MQGFKMQGAKVKTQNKQGWAISRVLLAFGLACILNLTAIADYTLYRLPGTNFGMILDGSITYNPGGTVTLKHPRGTLYFNARDVQVVKSPSTSAVFGSRSRGVTKSGSVDEILELSKWALHHGMLNKCKKLLGQAWKVDPQHAELRKLAGLMQYLNRQVSNSGKVESQPACGFHTNGTTFRL